MTTTTGIIYTALSALNTYSGSINVTSTNIANVETTGYCRQQAVIRSVGIVGSGVELSTVRRIYNAFLTTQLRSANEDLGKWEVENEILSEIEEIFTDTDDYGLSSALNDFWNAWQDVANDPSSTTARSVLASCSGSLADVFNSTSSDLKDIQASINDAVSSTVEEINLLVNQIADMNQKISQAAATEESVNTYQDSLDTLVLDLSSLIDISTYTNESGQICIQVADGKPLVEETTVWSLSTEKNTMTGMQDVTWVDSEGNAQVITGNITNGKLGGYLEIRDDVIPSYLAELDELAVKIMDEVNSLHTGGYDMDGQPGVSFFTGTGADDIAVNAEILADSEKIAAAATADGASGDGTNAIAIAELQNSLVLDGGTTTFSDYYTALVSEIGLKVQSAQASYESASDTAEFRKSQVASVSSVSTDEEIAKLALYQSAYEAAAKLTSVLDEMLETIIEM